MNQEKIQKLKDIARRTIKILELIEEGLTASQIALKAKCDRQLADYYLKITKNEKKED